MEWGRCTCGVTVVSKGATADIGIDPTAHALVAAGGQGGSEARGKGQE